MPITGQVNDLSLGELIELFCNKRKVGRLTVTYTEGVAYFYLKPGAIVHASFGSLSGAAAVDYALMLANGSFTFRPGVEAEEQTIDRAWTAVVLEGLRRIDEGLVPEKPSPNGKQKVGAPAAALDEELYSKHSQPSTDHAQEFGVLISQYPESGASSRRWINAPVLIAIALIVLGVGVPWGWYTHHKAVQIMTRENDAKRFEKLYAPPEPSPQSQDNATTENRAAAPIDKSASENSAKALENRERKSPQRGTSQQGSPGRK